MLWIYSSFLKNWTMNTKWKSGSFVHVLLCVTLSLTPICTKLTIRTGHVSPFSRMYARVCCFLRLTLVVAKNRLCLWAGAQWLFRAASYLVFHLLALLLGYLPATSFVAFLLPHAHHYGQHCCWDSGSYSCCKSKSKFVFAYLKCW